MKVEIRKNGILIVGAENNTEAYALQKWLEGQEKIPNNTQFNFPEFVDGRPVITAEDRKQQLVKWDE